MYRLDVGFISLPENIIIFECLSVVLSSKILKYMYASILHIINDLFVCVFKECYSCVESSKY